MAKKISQKKKYVKAYSLNYFLLAKPPPVNIQGYIYECMCVFGCAQYGGEKIWGHIHAYSITVIFCLTTTILDCIDIMRSSQI